MEVRQGGNGVQEGAWFLPPQASGGHVGGASGLCRVVHAGVVVTFYEYAALVELVKRGFIVTIAGGFVVIKAGQ